MYTVTVYETYITCISAVRSSSWTNCPHNTILLPENMFYPFSRESFAKARLHMNQKRKHCTENTYLVVVMLWATFLIHTAAVFSRISKYTLLILHRCKCISKHDFTFVGLLRLESSKLNGNLSESKHPQRKWKGEILNFRRAVCLYTNDTVRNNKEETT